MDKIQIRLLHQQTFCEYAISLEFIKGLEKPVPDRVEDPAKSATPKAVTKAIKNCTSKGVDVRMLRVEVVGDKLCGIVDELWFTKKAVFVISDMPRSPNGDPFLTDKRQSLGYCLAFKEQHPEYELLVVAAIRDSDTGKRLWVKTLDTTDEYDIKDCVDRIQGIIDGSKEAVPTQKGQKCRACRWAPVCDKAQS